ncbi:hypothetical protein Q4543_18330 [Salipiger sp. 1_MG-2023]|uniref:hypothetical protein n=1 Tax=Salipiger sp. 1_MG-2023 TaxID=3062665 RepID=UPI0026E2D7A5|nr:hypothetical protein [Salipiger sp. 1_MG-2023]MDO6587474.1 hypothetical protein [Salipiger sp. 1_MG-2023]
MAESNGPPAPLIKLRAFCLFPAEAADIHRAISPDVGGVVGFEVAAALTGWKYMPTLHNHATGLGGRDIPETTWADLIASIKDPDTPAFSICAPVRAAARRWPPGRPWKAPDRM